MLLVLWAGAQCRVENRLHRDAPGPFCSSKTSSVSRPDPDPARIMLGGLKFGQISTAEELGGSNETSKKH